MTENIPYPLKTFLYQMGGAGAGNGTGMAGFAGLGESNSATGDLNTGGFIDTGNGRQDGSYVNANDPDPGTAGSNTDSSSGSSTSSSTTTSGSQQVAAPTDTASTAPLGNTGQASSDPVTTPDAQSFDPNSAITNFLNTIFSPLATLMGGVDEAVQTTLGWAGYAWNLPNTAIGLAYGLAGYGVGMIMGTNPSIGIGGNAFQFTNNPFAKDGAITIGNVEVFGGSPSDMGADENLMGDHEPQHTIQGEVLGPLYLPSNLLGGIVGELHGGDWHDPWNWNEIGPQMHPPQPWPWP